MKILISNDDGYQALGIIALYEALKEIAKSEGYAYVIDKKLLLYSEGGIDATEKLKTKLGVK